MTEGSPNLDSLMRAAREAAERAYAPYSNFLVGAAILTGGGAVHAGCNVENASYGLSICAERSAATRMVSADEDDRHIKSVAVFSPNATPCFPCGACRQVLSEFGRDFRVDAVGPRRTSTWTMAELLPAAFGPDQLS